MATRALDVSTLIHALSTMEDVFLGKDRTWNGSKEFFDFYLHYKPLVSKLRDIKAKASGSHVELNEFLINEGFPPMFKPFDPATVGVASLLDKLVKWLDGRAALVDIVVRTEKKTYGGFRIEEGGWEMFDLDAIVRNASKVIRVKTSGDTSLWLLCDSFHRHSGLAMIQAARGCMDTGNRTRNFDYSALHIPKVDFEFDPDVSFLLGSKTFDKNSMPWEITQVFQKFKFRMNEEGARARVVSGVAGTLCCAGPMPVPKPPYIIRSPFYGWFIQDDVPDFPLAVFFADYDSWKEPSGSLEDLHKSGSSSGSSDYSWKGPGDQFAH